MLRHRFNTPFGFCALRWHAGGIAGFELPEASGRPADLVTPPDFIAALVARVRQHLTGEAQDFSDAPLDLNLVPEFQRQVFTATLAVKAGRTCSYGEIATALGQPPGASRAVGTALGANPWPLLVPCHRVVAANGHMTGFSGPGGIETKLKLLALEGNQLF